MTDGVGTREPREPTDAQIEAALNVAPQIFVPLAPYGGEMAPGPTREDVRRMLICRRGRRVLSRRVSAANRCEAHRSP